LSRRRWSSLGVVPRHSDDDSSRKEAVLSVKQRNKQAKVSVDAGGINGGLTVGRLWLVVIADGGNP
jgi:hypothetical protein